MNDALKKMLSAYDLSTVASVTDALREVIQEIALLELSRSSFFARAGFYGGTALRIFYLFPSINRHNQPATAALRAAL